MNESIYILLPVHNRREITRRFVECLKVQTYKNFHLVLIDDGSKDGTSDMVKEYISSLTVIRGKGNWWWAGSLQQGYRWLKQQDITGTDLVLIINDDTEFEADFLEHAVAFLQNRESTLLLAWSYCRADGRLLDTGINVNWKKFSFDQAVTPAEINCLSTRGLFMRMSDFFATGGFYPLLLPHYASDYEFTIRAHRKGMQLVSDASCRLRVDQSTTGYRKLHEGSQSFYLGRLFSNKSLQNPFMWTAFIFLSCPRRYKLLNLVRVWRNFFSNVYRMFRYWRIDNKIRIGASKLPLRVIIGTGGCCQKGWLPTDIEHLNILNKMDWRKFFKENSIDAIFAEHVWEHLTEADATTAAKNCYQYLKLGGYLRVAVPDGFHPSDNYIEAVKPFGHGFGSDDHKVLYNYKTLKKIFENAGFEVDLLEYFDEKGNFNRNPWNSEDGHVRRSERYDERNKGNKLAYTSIIIDAKKCA